MVSAVDAAKALVVGSPVANSIFRFANAYREAWLVVGVFGSAELRDEVERLLTGIGGEAVEVERPVIEELIRQHAEHGDEGLGAGG